MLLPVSIVLAVFVVSAAVTLACAASVRRRGARPGTVTGEAFIAAVAERNDLGRVAAEDGDVDGYIASLQTIQLAGGRRTTPSVGAAAIAAHESAHLLQHATGYRPWRVWWVLSVPALVIDFAALVLVVVALATGSATVAWVAAGLLPLPLFVGALSAVVERDAARRAALELAAHGLPEELRVEALRVLRAAAIAYVSETIFDLGYLLRRAGLRLRRGHPDDPPDFFGPEAGC